MPGMICAVAVCNNSKQKNPDVSFSRFPKDKMVRQLWVQKCRRSGKWNPDSCRVCSEHFKEDDYERDLQAELLKLPGKKKLKATAVPSRNLVKIDALASTTVAEQNSHLVKLESNIKLEQVIIENQDPVHDNNDNDSIPTETVSSGTTSSSSPLHFSYIKVENSYEVQHNQYASLLTENWDFRKQLQDMKK